MRRTIVITCALLMVGLVICPAANAELALVNIRQIAFADVTATSLVNDVLVNNYTNFDGGGNAGEVEQILMVNSSATAIGNNLSQSTISIKMGIEAFGN